MRPEYNYKNLQADNLQKTTNRPSFGRENDPRHRGPNVIFPPFVIENSEPVPSALSARPERKHRHQGVADARRVLLRTTRPLVPR